MSGEEKEVLEEMTKVVKSLHDRVEAQEKTIAELKGKAPEEPKKNKPSEEELKAWKQRTRYTSDI